MYRVTLSALVGLVALSMLGSASSAQVRFGAKLDVNTQPSNAEAGVLCRQNAPSVNCSWVLMDAFQREFPAGTNGHLAPKTGTIGKIRLISCISGTFVLQVTRANPATRQALVTRSGPVINYGADPQKCQGDTYRIQTFNVNVPVQKNDYLAVVATKVGFARCSSGGANTLLFAFPLMDGRGLRTANGQEGCWLLLEAEYKP
jgi:hypothetical protein